MPTEAEENELLEDNLESEDDSLFDEDSDEDFEESLEEDDFDPDEDSEGEDLGEGTEDDSDTESDEDESVDDLKAGADTGEETKDQITEVDPADPVQFISQFKDESEAVAKGIKPEFVPNSKEMLDAAEEEAREKVIKEFGEFDQFDTKHLARFNAYNLGAIRRREQSYNDAVNHIKTGFQKKGRLEDNRKAAEKLDAEMNEILSTPDLKARFKKAIKKISVGSYEEIQNALEKGDTSKLTGFARRVAGVQGQMLEGKLSKVKPSGNRKRNKGEVYGSDILGF